MTMRYAEFLLRRRAAAVRQLTAITAMALSQGSQSTSAISYLADLENVARGR